MKRNGQENLLKKTKKKLIEKEPGEKRENNKEIKRKRERVEEKAKENEGKITTRAQRNQRVRMERSGVLTMSALLVDSALLSKCITFTKLTSAVITSYIMFLYEQIKKEQIHDRGICFMNPSAISRVDQRKPKPKLIEDVSRAVADRLYKRKGNYIILLPYNPWFDFPFK
ncbi:hypothetical protein HanOQP8_Chr10g0356321 [Helianthus annuus]|nr:hypothetical protein HanOQP8_Chr10g0356321 [Helianthus annuus]